MRNKISNTGWTSYSKVQNIVNFESFECQHDVENSKPDLCMKISVKIQWPKTNIYSCLLAMCRRCILNTWSLHLMCFNSSAVSLENKLFFLELNTISEIEHRATKC